jgi:hypothetical protein
MSVEKQPKRFVEIYTPSSGKIEIKPYDEVFEDDEEDEEEEEPTKEEPKKEEPKPKIRPPPRTLPLPIPPRPPSVMPKREPEGDFIP